MRQKKPNLQFFVLKNRPNISFYYIFELVQLFLKVTD